MPRLSVWFLRSALVYLACGFTAGGLVLFHKGMALHAVVWQLLPLHIEFVLIGWTVQLAMGIVFWIGPRLMHGPARGNERLIWVAYGALNSGVLLVAFGQWLNTLIWVTFVGRLLEFLAVAIVAAALWPPDQTHRAVTTGYLLTGARTMWPVRRPSGRARVGAASR